LAVEGENMKILVAGQAKTGTTGLFFKIRNSLEGNVRLLFEPSEYKSLPKDDEKTVLAKILIGKKTFANYASFDVFDKKICIIRDPRDRLVSQLLYQTYVQDFIEDDAKANQFINMLRLKEEDSKAVSVQEIWRLQNKLSNKKCASFNRYAATFSLQLEFCDQHPDYFVVKYEDFVSEQLGPLGEYLGFPLKGNSEPDKEFKRVVRTKATGDWKNWFLPEDIDLLRSNSTIVKYMARFGYEDDWELPYEQKVSPEYSSEYTKRLILEKRTLIEIERFKPKQSTTARKITSEQTRL
jgi:hypothetical protein